MFVIIFFSLELVHQLWTNKMFILSLQKGGLYQTNENLSRISRDNGHANLKDQYNLSLNFFVAEPTTIFNLIYLQEILYRV